MVTTYEQLRAYYQEGNVPWDAELPPPELMDLAQGLRPGRALDLGCGYGRTAIYLAQRGWRVDAVDFIDLALVEAGRRGRTAGTRAVCFCLASVVQLPFRSASYDFAVDIGCAHSLDPLHLKTYCTGLARLLQPGAYFLLFGRLIEPVGGEPEPEPQPGVDAEGGPSGLDEEWLRQLMSPAFILERYERGMTHMADGDSWPSAWFWWRRNP